VIAAVLIGLLLETPLKRSGWASGADGPAMAAVALALTNVPFVLLDLVARTGRGCALGAAVLRARLQTLPPAALAGDTPGRDAHSR